MISGPDDRIPLAPREPTFAENMAAVQRAIDADPEAQRAMRAHQQALGGGLMGGLLAYLKRESDALRTKLHKAKQANDG